MRRLVGYHLASSGFFDSVFQNYRLSDHWLRRVSEVLSCPDNEAIPRCPEAGRIRKGIQYMHNGLKIHLGSYYGPEYARLLLQSRGVHEPQEEKVFAEVLKHIPAGATMIELGAFWSFYSMWFNREVKNARNIMVEPDSFNLGQGKRNFRLNGMKGHFTQAFVGRQSESIAAGQQICIDDFVEQQALDFIHVLHSDIQGFEYDMLEGATKTIAAGKIAYIFISTHSNEIHKRCLQFLKGKEFEIIAEADLENTYSEDGLVVARAPFVEKPGKISIAQKQKPVHD